MVYAMMGMASLLIGVIIVVKILDWRKPIRIRIMRKLGANSYEIIKMARFKATQLSYKFGPKNQQVDYQFWPKKIATNEPLDTDVIRQGRRIHLTFLEGNPNPISYQGGITTPDGRNWSLIADSHFLADIVKRIPTFYYLIMALCIVVAVAGIFGAVYISQQSQTSVQAVTNQFGDLQAQYNGLYTNYTNLVWYLYSINFTWPQVVPQAPNGTVIIR